MARTATQTGQEKVKVDAGVVYDPNHSERLSFSYFKRSKRVELKGSLDGPVFIFLTLTYIALSTAVMVYFSLPQSSILAFIILFAFWEYLNRTKYPVSFSFIITKSNIDFIRRNFFLMKRRVFQSDAIERIIVAPVSVTRPIPGRPYARKKYRVELEYAGKREVILSGACHAEANTVAFEIVRSTPVENIEFYETTPGLLPLSIQGPLETQSQLPVISDDSNSGKVEFCPDSGEVKIYSRVKFSLNMLNAFVAMFYFFPKLFFDDVGFVDFIAYLLIIFTPFILFACMLLQDLTFREVVAVDGDDLRKSSSSLFSSKDVLFERCLISNISVCSEIDEYLSEEDVKTKPAFKVRFDYGLSTHSVGRNLTYSEARKVEEILIQMTSDKGLSITDRSAA
ncbi:hypothetical protein [Roseibium suaedae]|uniref:Uncharacterized protein n=1 Tax=Roseibium suaedae TaxID=735517 RepID=A0A1M7KD10_9HYPH|nr:hypothetical protein [Roseibium suaedae]SHM63140.1 hypothetical protein SAMN05444272_2795 [Roseibium suaedae]